jgi:quercetin dioxygenase-like cupin family protein
METTSQHLIPPGDGETVQIGPLGVRFMLDAGRTGGGFALVEHPIAPRGLAAPLHTHTHEDEYTYVLEGEVGVQVGDDVISGRPGDLVAKPRGVPHAFWNAGDAPARVLELISPAGFERYFMELAPLLPPARPEPDFEGLGRVREKYGLEMDMGSIERLTREHGLAAR